MSDRPIVPSSRVSALIGWDGTMGRDDGTSDRAPRDGRKVIPTTDDPALARLIMSEQFWVGDGWTKLAFRHRASGRVAQNAFPGMKPFVAPNRIGMRGLSSVPA